MPTKKPRIQALVEDNIYLKFKKLCIITDRTESKLSGKIITEYINNYESEHGTIDISTPSDNSK